MSKILRVEVYLPENHWAGVFTRENPNAVLQIIETMPLSKGRGTAQIATDESLLENLNRLSGIESVEYLGDNQAMVTIASGGGGFIRALRKAGVVPRTPFDVIDGWADWTIQCNANQAKHLMKEIKLDDIPIRLKSTRARNEKLLTSRQSEILELAKRKGYWETPRSISLTELAGILNVSKSTMSVILHTIEGKIIDRYYEELM